MADEEQIHQWWHLTPVAQAAQQLCYDIAYAAWLARQNSIPQPPVVLDDAK